MLAEAAVDALVTMLKAKLPESLEIKSYAISEQDLRSVSNYPVVFVLCPSYKITEWMADGYIDATYTMVLGAIALNQNVETLKRSLYQIIEEIVKALIKSQSDATLEYTMLKRQVFDANFGPIFTQANTEQFMADAQIQVSMKRIQAETLDVS